MTTYTAWDGREYPWPPPDSWYEASDDRWWPEGHGPGAAAEAAGAVDEAVDDAVDVVAPATNAPREADLSGDATPADAPTVVDTPVPSTELADDAQASEGGDRDAVVRTPAEMPSHKGRAFLLVFIALLGVGALVGGIIWFARPGPEAPDPVATTVAPTQAEDIDPDGVDTATEEVRSGPGSPSDPFAIGDTFEVRYDSSDGEKVWTVSVTGPAVDRTQAVLDENQFNDPPPTERDRFVVAPVRITYVSGPETASLFDFSFKAVGAEGVVRTTFDPSCGVVPNDLDVLGELVPGGTIEGNVCWVVPETEIGTLRLIFEVFFEDIDIFVDLQ